MNKGRKTTGGRYKKNRKKKLYELAGQKKTVKVGEERRKTKKVRGGHKKIFLLRARQINIQEGKKSRKLEIKNVLETPSNRFLARQNILTKGAIVETEIGRVRITNKPSQEGMINGVLIEEKED